MMCVCLEGHDIATTAGYRNCSFIVAVIWGAPDADEDWQAKHGPTKVFMCELQACLLPTHRQSARSTFRGRPWAGVRGSGKRARGRERGGEKRWPGWRHTHVATRRAFGQLPHPALPPHPLQVDIRSFDQIKHDRGGHSRYKLYRNMKGA